MSEGEAARLSQDSNLKAAALVHRGVSTLPATLTRQFPPPSFYCLK